MTLSYVALENQFNFERLDFLIFKIKIMILILSL